MHDTTNLMIDEIERTAFGAKTGRFSVSNPNFSTLPSKRLGGGDLTKPFHYLAGPMTGYAEYNFPAFEAAAEMLRDQGYNVVNPAELDHEVEAKFEAKPPRVGVLEYDDSWRECLRRDLAVVGDENCIGVFCIDGWEKSRGARLETYVADALDLPIYLVRGLSLTEINRGAALRAAGVIE